MLAIEKNCKSSLKPHAKTKNCCWLICISVCLILSKWAFPSPKASSGPELILIVISMAMQDIYTTCIHLWFSVLVLSPNCSAHFGCLSYLNLIQIICSLGDISMNQTELSDNGDIQNVHSGWVAMTRIENHST